MKYIVRIWLGYIVVRRCTGFVLYELLVVKLISGVISSRMDLCSGF